MYIGAEIKSKQSKKSENRVASFILVRLTIKNCIPQVVNYTAEI